MYVTFSKSEIWNPCYIYTNDTTHFHSSFLSFIQSRFHFWYVVLYLCHIPGRNSISINTCDYLNLMYVMRITSQTSNQFCSYIPYKRKYSGSSSYPGCHCDKQCDRDTRYKTHICDKVKTWRIQTFQECVCNIWVQHVCFLNNFYNHTLHLNTLNCKTVIWHSLDPSRDSHGYRLPDSLKCFTIS